MIVLFNVHFGRYLKCRCGNVIVSVAYQTQSYYPLTRIPLCPSVVHRLVSVNPAALKRQIVKALQAMSRSLQRGEQVSAILNRSQVWVPPPLHHQLQHGQIPHR